MMNSEIVFFLPFNFVACVFFLHFAAAMLILSFVAALLKFYILLPAFA